MKQAEAIREVTTTSQEIISIPAAQANKLLADLVTSDFPSQGLVNVAVNKSVESDGENEVKTLNFSLQWHGKGD